jgi:hypothetical protein
MLNIKKVTTREASLVNQRKFVEAIILATVFFNREKINIDSLVLLMMIE